MLGYSKKQQLKVKSRPKASQRGKIKPRDYQMSLEMRRQPNGDYGCYSCGSSNVEMHHVVYRSQGGRGVWRNLVPLCKEHHSKAHSNKGYSDRLKHAFRKMYGKHHYKDEWDLYDDGLIEEPTKECYEVFYHA